MTKRTVKELTLLMLSAMASYLLLEAAVRALFPWYDPARQVVFRLYNGTPLGPPNSIVYQISPDSRDRVQIIFNDYGYRDHKDLASARTSDWFVVGDSHAFGWGVAEADRFSNVLDESLPFRVFNISIPTDIQGYHRLLRHAKKHGALINNVIVSICMENDLRNYGGMDPDPIPTEAPWKSHIRVWMKTHSAVYLLISDKVKGRQELRRALEKKGVIRTVENTMRMNTDDLGIVLSSASILQEIITDYENAIVLIIPSRGLWSGTNQATEGKMHDLFVTQLRQAGISVVDMRRLFKLAGSPLDFYFSTDAHVNELGHRIIAEALAAQITHGQQKACEYVAPLRVHAPQP